ncbi:MAG: hypothetical protein M3M94_01675, partial [Actinomycetota bacterium]|nr:hypothetical protein [Actinomycetota bacterium]
MKPDAVSQAEAVLAERAVSWTAVASRGYSIAEHWIVELATARTVFVKRAVSEEIAARLRDERIVYESLSCEFMPRYLDWAEG